MIKIDKKYNQLIAVYIVWAFVHLLFLLIGSKSRNAKSHFWPFDDLSEYTISNSYDFTEFFAYVIGPPILLLAYFLFTKSQKPD